MLWLGEYIAECILTVSYLNLNSNDIINLWDYIFVVPATKSSGSILNRRRLARRAEPMDGCSNAGIQRLKSLGYEIHPCISSCGPAIGCSNLLQADLVRLKTCRNDDV